MLKADKARPIDSSFKPSMDQIEEIENEIIKDQDDFERTLEAVYGRNGVIECMEVGNTAPLDLIIAAARREIKKLRGKLNE